MKCRRCHKPIPVNAKYCPHCSRRQKFGILQSLFKLLLIFSLIVLIIEGVIIYKYRFEIYQYVLKDKIKTPVRSNKAEHAKIDAIFEKYKDGVFGIDLSQYQGKINWKEMKELRSNVPIQFVIIRATMGDDGKDKQFNHNWRNTKKQGFIRGAYHYYRPNENSYKQADNFIQNVTLNKGDMVPVLDIEEISTKQSMANLRLGLKRWLTKIKEHYGVRPIIYTADAFYNLHLRTGEFDDYTIWIANFNRINKPWTSGWKIWQFTEEGIIKGIDHHVDFNVYNGTREELNELIIK